MKAKWNYLYVALLALGTSTAMYSCSDDEPNDEKPPVENPDTPDTPDSPDANRKLNEREQKAKLSTVSKDFMNEYSSDNFKDLGDLARYANDQYIDNPDFSDEEVSKIFNEALDASTTLVKDTVTHTGYGYIYHESYYKRLIVLSDYTGHFTAGNNGWQKTSDASDLQFTFNDQKAQTCVLTVSHSGNTKKIWFGESNDWDSSYENDNYISYDKYYDEYINVPEHITMTLVQGGTTRISVQVDIDHNSFAGPEYDLSKDAISTNVSVQIGDYNWLVERAAASGAAGTASVKGSIAKAGKTLVKYEASASGIQASNDSLNKAGAVNLSVDIMGKVQAKGTVKNAKAFIDNMENADDNDENESAFKNYLDLANQQVDLGIYFDKGSVRQCDLVFLAFEEEEYYGGRYWTYEPAFRFDETSSSAMGDYFEDSSFDSVIDVFEDLVKSYEELLGM